MKLSLHFNTWLYFFAQSINLTAAVMSVSMAALVGMSLAPNPGWSTAPYGFQFFCVMLGTWVAARLMVRIGRKKSFLFATLPLALAGVTGYLAVELREFYLLVISHGLLGIYIAFANFNRFAATDGIDVHLKSKAISLVVAGGVVAAILGPLLTGYLKNFKDWPDFSACYAAFSFLALFAFVVYGFVDEAKPMEKVKSENKIHEGLLGIFSEKKY